MLNKRTQILFDKDTYQALADKAMEQNTSIGALVRKAVKTTYQPKKKRLKGE